MARRDSGAVAFVVVFSRLPSWVCLGLAVGAWFGFGALVESCSGTITSENLAEMLAPRIMAPLFQVFRYLIPGLLIVSALVGTWVRFTRSRRLDAATKSPSTALESMSWRQFEQLLADAFRRQGYTVCEAGGRRPDGGVDLRLRRDGQLHLVQAKHWKTQRVGVKVVRELYGVMTSEGAASALLVTSGGFTAEAVEFAREKPLRLIDGAALAVLLSGAEAPAAQPVASTPFCPNCGKGMVRREARRGANAGKGFWGCSDFPRCRGIVNLAP